MDNILFFLTPKAMCVHLHADDSLRSALIRMEAARYAAEGQFGVGSMLPKVEAAMKFVRANPGKKAIITSLDKCLDALDGKTGTVITFA